MRLAAVTGMLLPWGTKSTCTRTITQSPNQAPQHTLSFLRTMSTWKGCRAAALPRLIEEIADMPDAGRSWMEAL